MNIVFTKDAPAPIGPYSQAIMLNGTLYCSGQIAINPETGEFVVGNIAEQTKTVCSNIAALLSAAGLDFNNVIKTSCFLTSMKDFSDFNKIYEQYFISKPVRSCVAVKELPKNALVEIEVMAVTI